MIAIWIYYILLLIALLAGLAINIFTLPGLWVMLLAAVIYAWLTGFALIGWGGILTLLILCIAAEIVELSLGGLGAKKAGGSKRAMIGAIIGALLGGIFLTFLVPIPVIGTIVGVCTGSFLGAAILEFWHKGEIDQSLRVGVGAAKGRFMGIISKLMFGVVILLTSLILAFPIRFKRPVPTSLPATPAKPQATTTRAG